MSQFFFNRTWMAAASFALAGMLHAADAKPAAETKVDAPAPAADHVAENEETIVIGGTPTPGWPILPANETEYRFKLKITGDIISLKWADLDENERKRVQKIYGMETRGAQKVFGDKITGIRLRLKSGKTIEGLALPERDQSGKKALKTAGVPLMLINEYDIESSENFEAFESDFFSPMEVYNKWVLEKPPGINDAVAHFALAQRVANIGLFGKAIDHLKMAAAIDPKMEERNKDFYTQLVADDAKQRALELYTRMINAKNSGDFGTAFYLIDQLDRNFPNSDYRSRWEALRPVIEGGMKTEIVKRVIQMSYTVAMDLLQKKFYAKVKVDDKNNIVPSIPGKQVTTKHGHIFRGTLEGAEAADTSPGAQTPATPSTGASGSGGSGGDLVLRVGETRVTIQGKEIVSVQDIDLSTSAREITAAFDDLKDYVTDAARPDGLKMQMIAKISQTLREPESKVKEIFDTRLNAEAVYKDGVYTKSPVYATLHDAFYGAGSWLREGSKPAPRQQNQQNNNQRKNNNNSYNNRNGNGNNNNQQQQPDPQEDPATTDDPAIWWKAQSGETQLGILRAMAAEKVFNAKDVMKGSCTHCRGTGQIPVIGKGGNIESDRCPTCRGIGVLFKILYR